MGASSDGSVDLTADLRTALQHGGLGIAFQPEFDLRSARITAAEALVRWTHPTLGPMQPAQFVPLAEQSELIVELGTWVIETSLATYADWCRQLPRLDIVLRINVAIAQLARPLFAAGLHDALTRHSVAADRVCIEITEGHPRHADLSVLESVHALRELGMHVAVDDLANGYSTLSMLRTHPVDVVKIDRALVGEIDRDPKAAVIVAALVTLADRLGLTLVAEGIETQAERDRLVDLGCRRGQGYLLAEPLPAAEVLRALAEPGQRRPRPTGGSAG